MGENVLKGQVESFVKGRDLSLQDMAIPTLFDRSEIISTIYTAAPMEGCTLSEGDLLEAHASADGRYVNLAKGHICVAQIGRDGAESLLDSLRQLGGPGIVPMEVTNVSAVSGFIKAVVAGATSRNE